MIKESRRNAIKTVGAMGAALVLHSPALASSKENLEPLKLGMIADLHGGLARDAESRLDAFLEAMKKENCNALVQLGDFAFPNRKHQHFADKLNGSSDQVLHVIGNHDLDFNLSKKDCLRAWGMPASFYRKDLGGIRILVLDGNDKGSPTHRGGYPSFIGDKQKEWLQKELEQSDKPVLILSHQPLAGRIAIDNAESIQKTIASHRSKVILCINGHSHVDSLFQVDGVAYLHLNSASYFWVGGKERMAYYDRPLFATVAIDPATSTVNVSGITGKWENDSPKDLGYFDRKDAPAEQIVQPRIRSHHVSQTELKVMTWNIWGKLNQDKRYEVDGKSARQRTIEILESSGADVIAMIETYGSAKEIAKALGFHYHTPDAKANLCIFSRYPLTDTELLNGLNPFSFIAATVRLPGGQAVRIYDIWLTSGGRHIVKIKDKTVSDQDFAKGDKNRAEHLNQLLRHENFRKHLNNASKVPVVVAGDFNCVSHLDHTNETSKKNLNHSRVLPIQVSQAMAERKFIDTYRDANPNVTAQTLGHTWTTVGKDYVYETGKGFVRTENHPRPEYQDPYARIDYIYALGKRLSVMESSVIKHHPTDLKKTFPYFPSDHAAVLTTFQVKKKN